MREWTEFKVGTKRKFTDEGTIEVVKKTYHFTTFKIVTKDMFGEDLNITFRRKEQFMHRDNGWLVPSTPTMGVDWRGLEIYACDFE